MRHGLLLGLMIAFTPLALHAAEKPAPLKALMVTGGCCHDYENQKRILSEGISQRANVEWTIVHEGGSSTDHKVSIYNNKDWAKGFDVIVHNECFADVKDVDFIHNITEAHKAGVPAVMIHCAMHCYRGQTDAWFELCGVTSHNHGPHQPIVVQNVERNHPVMRGFPGEWKTPQGELYNIAKVWPTATPLAHGYLTDTAKSNVCIWVNQYGKARVFGTTLGHHNVTMEQPEYLDLVSRGLLWTCGKLTAEGKSAAGYAGTGVPAAAPAGPQPTPAQPTPAK